MKWGMSACVEYPEFSGVNTALFLLRVMNQDRLVTNIAPRKNYGPEAKSICFFWLSRKQYGEYFMVPAAMMVANSPGPRRLNPRHLRVKVTPYPADVTYNAHPLPPKYRPVPMAHQENRPSLCTCRADRQYNKNATNFLDTQHTGWCVETSTLVLALGAVLSADGAFRTHRRSRR